MIDILLATYNGEKYLDLQLFSIVNQTYKDWNLYIHDDGSTDDTVDIIKKWGCIDNRIHFIEDDKKHLGPGNNFIHLIPYAKSEYVCFCDQDDFWFENKLEKYVVEMEKYDKSIPICILFSAYVWNNEKITPLLNEYSKTLESMLFTGGTQGCSLVFNQILVKYAQLFINKNIYLHDYLIAFIAVLFGKYIYNSNRLMLYRQHANNVTGHLPKSKFEKVEHALLKNINEPFIYPKMYNDIVTIYETIQDELKTRDKKLIRNYIFLAKKNRFQRFFILLLSKYTVGQHSHFYFIIKYFLRKKYL